MSQALLNEDNDVAVERKRVLKGNGKYDMLVLENLSKVCIMKVVNISLLWFLIFLL